MAWAQSAPWSSSYANTAYNGVHAFRFTSAVGDERYVRWSFQPQAAFEPLEVEQRQAAEANYLADELATRLAQGPVRWTLAVTLAEAGDPIEDPSQPWPETRTRVAAGSFVLERAYAEADGDCRDINFDPTILPEGIAASADPVLAARSSAYSVSFNRRQREVAGGAGPARGEAQ